MKIFGLLVIAFFFSATLAAQPGGPEYTRLVDIAFEKLKAGECQTCVFFYEQAFERSRHSALSHLRAALCAETCGDTAKSAFFIQKAVEINWGNTKMVLNDTESYPEFEAPDFAEAKKSALFSADRRAGTLGVNFKLMDTLAQILEDDQKYRRQNDSIWANFSTESPEFKLFHENWVRQDSLNLIKILDIIDRYGYPGNSLVGGEYASVAWLVIQHAPLEVQEKYLPMITTAAEKNDMPRGNWALLVDRIRMYKGQPQLYGSQLKKDPSSGEFRFHDIEDEANVNQRRAEVGLEPIEDYAARFGFKYQPPVKKD